MNELPKDAVLLIDGGHGQYIPQVFVGTVDRKRITGISDDQWAILSAGPEHEWYWEVWDEVLNGAIVTNPSTQERYYLHHDGDLWLIPEDAEWPDPYEDDLMDWDEQDRMAAESERIEMHRREQ